jgi:hypothetical protein
MHHILGSRIAGNFGAYLSRYFSLQPRHFGEWAILAIAGTLLSAIVAWAYLRGPRIFREVSNDMLLLVATLVFFGVFIDAAAAIRLGPVVKFGLAVVEDGGEMVVVSLILWYAFLLAIRNGNPGLFLHDFLSKPPSGRGT